ncbi:uncharacterized protein [Euphorbia lathyris]|uniref:uncharacterized protein n=1 Tax=Euphorbia lathyris TaxID=212925 RepID=UPI003313315F
MQFFSKARRLARVLKPQVLINSAADRQLLSSDFQFVVAPQSLHQWQNHQSFSFYAVSGNDLQMVRHPIYLRTGNASFCTEANTVESTPTEAVKELYDKILDSVNVKRTMSPNAWLWSLISNCKNHEDIKLLFDTLQNLRRFRLSNLRIHSDFNSHLCREVSKACARVGAIDFGKKLLWKHNIYGLTPDIVSVNQLLAYAKEHNDLKLMVEVMKLVKKNDISLAPSVADNVLSICYNAGNWPLMLKYSKNFVKGGVKLRKSAFDMWMDFSIKRGDTESLWRVEKLRSELWEQHTLVSGFSCAKGLILEHKPEDAAAVIQVLDQSLPDTKKPGIVVELQKLVGEWPLDVVKHQPEDKRKELAAALKSDIPAMVTGLIQMGIEANVNLEDLTSKELTS